MGMVSGAVVFRRDDGSEGRVEFNHDDVVIINADAEKGVDSEDGAPLLFIKKWSRLIGGKLIGKSPKDKVTHPEES